MKKSIGNFLTGFASVIVLFPSTDYSKFLPKGSESEQIYRHWKETGDYISRAMEDYKSQSGQEAIEYGYITDRSADG